MISRGPIVKADGPGPRLRKELFQQLSSHYGPRDRITVPLLPRPWSPLADIR